MKITDIINSEKTQVKLKALMSFSNAFLKTAFDSKMHSTCFAHSLEFRAVHSSHPSKCLGMVNKLADNYILSLSNLNCLAMKLLGFFFLIYSGNDIISTNFRPSLTKPFCSEPPGLAHHEMTAKIS